MQRPSIQWRDATGRERPEHEMACSQARTPRTSTPPRDAELGAGGAVRSAAPAAPRTESRGCRSPR
eukprot:9844368-Alexandrium_andersonii.AAC.1